MPPTRSLVIDMPVFLRMAFRNIWEHKAKSFIVGTLLALGVIILIVGNAFIDAADEGIRKSFISNYTGNVFIHGKTDSPISLFGVQSIGGLEDTPTIPSFERVLEYSKSIPGVTGATSMASGFGIVSLEDINEESVEGSRQDSFLFLFGIDASTYWEIFDQIEIVQGKLFIPGETGLILPEKRIENISKYLGRKIEVGDSILINGISNAGIKIREMKLFGTYRSKIEGAGPEQLSYIDIDSLRVLSGMTVGASESFEISEEQLSMLAISEEEDLFSGDIIEDTPGSSGKLGESALENILGDISGRERLAQADYGAWNFILLRTDNQSDANKIIASLNLFFSKENIDAVAGDWKQASGPYGQSVDVLRIIFAVAILILAAVAIIIIMNTLVISVIERTGEIGTMRAIGSQRGFIRKLFASETIMLSFIFGLAGIVISFIIVWILRTLNISADSQFLIILFGGKTLNPVISARSVLVSLALILGAGFIAHFYPVSVALKIQPVRAMQNE